MGKYNALGIAKYLTEKYELTSSAKLQKLLYLVYLGYYYETNKFLFDEEFEAGIYGAVEPITFEYVKKHGLNFGEEINTNIVEKDKEIIDYLGFHLNKIETDVLIWETQQTKPGIIARDAIDDDELCRNKITKKIIKNCCLKPGGETLINDIFRRQGGRRVHYLANGLSKKKK